MTCSLNVFDVSDVSELSIDPITREFAQLSTYSTVPVVPEVPKTLCDGLTIEDIQMWDFESPFETKIESKTLQCQKPGLYFGGQESIRQESIRQDKRSDRFDCVERHSGFAGGSSSSSLSGSNLFGLNVFGLNLFGHRQNMQESRSSIIGSLQWRDLQLPGNRVHL